MKDLSLDLVILSSRDARMTDVIRLDNTKHMKEEPHLDDKENLKTREEKMNGVTGEKEKKTSRARKRERPQKSSEAGITEVENVNDVGNLEEDSMGQGHANLTDVALKQEVQRRRYPVSLNSTFVVDQWRNIQKYKLGILQ